jgi:SAM-dependent methyltransferase
MSVAVHASEARFHDAWAASIDLSQVDVRAAFEAPAALENRFILERIGPLGGLRVLDIGAGLGESSVYFALRGAEVTVADLSPGMVDAAVRLGALHGVRLEPLVTCAEDLAAPSDRYDVVYIANTIHHVCDRRAMFREMRRVLKPCGRFYSWDPIAYNPVIEAYRRMATAVRSSDETPLTRRDVRLAREYFPDVRHREFWIASLALFLKYYAIDRIHPNEDRYWKRILRETDRSLGWWKPLRALDSALTQLPIIRWLAWNMVLWGSKPG